MAVSQLKSRELRGIESGPRKDLKCFNLNPESSRDPLKVFEVAKYPSLPTLWILSCFNSLFFLR